MKSIVKSYFSYNRAWSEGKSQSWSWSGPAFISYLWKRGNVYSRLSYHGNGKSDPWLNNSWSSGQ